MGHGISAIPGFAVAMAISPVPIITVILMLFSRRARVNGPSFLTGWVYQFRDLVGALGRGIARLEFPT
ncbi:MAG TPA: hypothetical protein VES02_11095 [Dermatophilaceae bacterium]|nr:hypothetical protein [Dermatophilaceae bacterium]